jgi:hypothetical protein
MPMNEIRKLRSTQVDPELVDMLGSDQFIEGQTVDLGCPEFDQMMERCYTGELPQECSNVATQLSDLAGLENAEEVAYKPLQRAVQKKVEEVVKASRHRVPINRMISDSFGNLLGKVNREGLEKLSRNCILFVEDQAQGIRY